MKGLLLIIVGVVPTLVVWSIARTVVDSETVIWSIQALKLARVFIECRLINGRRILFLFCAQRRKTPRALVDELLCVIVAHVGAEAMARCPDRCRVRQIDGAPFDYQLQQLISDST